MEKVRFGHTDLDVSVVTLGTWVTGGWAWGGSDEEESVRTVRTALELGINFIDTAPVYGFGRSEEIIGKALKQSGKRSEVVLATKCGLEWDERERIRRNASPERIRAEVEQSLRRLGVDRIDLYQIHWPDPKTPFEESLTVLGELQQQGKIRYIGLSNFNRAQIESCLAGGKVSSLQPPFNLFERQAAVEILPFCAEKGIATLVYGGLCRGLLTGKFTGSEAFPRGDLRRNDPKFKPDRFRQYLKAVAELQKLATRSGKTMAQFALRWALHQAGVSTVIAGARTVRQVTENAGVSGWRITDEDLAKVEAILTRHIKTPIGPEFMAPQLA